MINFTLDALRLSVPYTSLSLDGNKIDTLGHFTQLSAGKLLHKVTPSKWSAGFYR